MSVYKHVYIPIHTCIANIHMPLYSPVYIICSGHLTKENITRHMAGLKFLNPTTPLCVNAADHQYEAAFAPHPRYSMMAGAQLSILAWYGLSVMYTFSKSNNHGELDNYPYTAKSRYNAMIIVNETQSRCPMARP